MTSYIYALVDPQSDDIRYVGKSIDPRHRLANHLWLARSGGEAGYVYNWLRTLRDDPWIWILEEATDDDWPESEAYWIAALREDGQPLTNVTEGGEGPAGLVHSEETRARISAANSGRHLSAEQKRRLSELNTGKRLSDEHKRKISASRKGIVFTQMHRRNLSKALAGRKLSDQHRRKVSQGMSAYRESERARQGKRVCSQCGEPLIGYSCWGMCRRCSNKSYYDAHREEILERKRRKRDTA